MSLIICNFVAVIAAVISLFRRCYFCCFLAVISAVCGAVGEQKRRVFSWLRGLMAVIDISTSKRVAGRAQCQGAPASRPACQPEAGGPDKGAPAASQGLCHSFTAAHLAGGFERGA